MARAGPLIYLGFFLLFAYALSAGNAGTGFRYRTQIVAVLICILACLWEVAAARRGAAAERRPRAALPLARRRDGDRRAVVGAAADQLRGGVEAVEPAVEQHHHPLADRRASTSGGRR